MRRWILFIFSLYSLSAHSGVISPEGAQTRKHPSGATIQMFIQKSTHPKASASLSVLTIPAKGQVPEHQDSEDEFLYVLEGEGDLWIDGKKSRLRTGEAAFLPKRAKVKFQAGDAPVKVLQMFAPSGSEEKYHSWGEAESGRKPKKPDQASPNAASELSPIYPPKQPSSASIAGPLRHLPLW